MLKETGKTHLILYFVQNIGEWELFACMANEKGTSGSTLVKQYCKKYSHNNLAKILEFKSVRTVIDYCGYFRESYIMEFVLLLFKCGNSKAGNTGRYSNWAGPVNFFYREVTDGTYSCNLE